MNHAQRKYGQPDNLKNRHRLSSIVIRLFATGIAITTLAAIAAAEENRVVAPIECTRPPSEDQRIVGTFGNYRVQSVPFRLTSEQKQACIAACDLEYADKQWAFTSSAVLPNSSSMLRGLPYIREKFGDPLRVEQSRDEGFFDIDIYMVPRTLFYPGFRVSTHDYIDEDFTKIAIKDAEIQESDVIYELIVDGANIGLQFGLAVGSSRAEVEEAIGLPCITLARYGLEQMRLPGSPYRYYVEDPNGSQKYSFDVRFDEGGRLVEVHWILHAWH